jgi:predicted ester cyclase
MKKQILIAITAMFFLTSCADNAKNAELVKKSTVEASNIKFYNNIWEVAINEGRANILDSVYADNAVLHTVPETKGKVNCAAYYKNYVTGFTNRKFIVKEVIASGNKLVKYWQFKGKHTGVFFGIQATNKDVDVIGCTIATIVDGKITEEQDFFDNLEFLQQLGIMQRQ